MSKQVVDVDKGLPITDDGIHGLLCVLLLHRRRLEGGNGCQRSILICHGHDGYQTLFFGMRGHGRVSGGGTVESSTDSGVGFDLYANVVVVLGRIGLAGLDRGKSQRAQTMLVTGIVYSYR